MKFIVDVVLGAQITDYFSQRSFIYLNKIQHNYKPTCGVDILRGFSLLRALLIRPFIDSWAVTALLGEEHALLPYFYKFLKFIFLN